MPRLRFLTVSALALLLIVPAFALAQVKRGTYIEVKTQTYVATDATATKIKSLNIPCVRDGQQTGANLIAKSVKITGGKFTYNGKSTLRGERDTVIHIKITGTFATNKVTGTITYPDAPAPCDPRSYSAKYYGLNPKG